MGAGFGRLLNIVGSSKKEQRIVMVGLDNAGKTTILYQVKMGEVVQTTPTIGSFLNLLFKSIAIQVYFCLKFYGFGLIKQEFKLLFRINCTPHCCSNILLIIITFRI